MMEIRECRVFSGNSFVCEQLSGREKAGKSAYSKNIKKKLHFQGRPRLAAKRAQ